MLAGRLPFEGESITEIVDASCTTSRRRRRASITGLTPDVDAIVARALEKEPAFRYQTARAMLRDDLRGSRAIERGPPRARAFGAAAASRRRRSDAWSMPSPS